MSSSPSNKGSVRSRVGSLMRRASLIPSRPGSPPKESKDAKEAKEPKRKSSSSSLRSRFTLRRSSKDHGSFDGTRKSSEEQRPEPELLRVQPVDPVLAGVPSPIIEVDSPQVTSPPKPWLSDAAPVQKSESQQPAVLDPEDATSPIHDEPESIKDDEEEKPEQLTVSFEDGQEGSKDLVRDDTPYPSNVPSPIDAPEDAPVFVPAVMPKGTIHDMPNPWDNQATTAQGPQLEDPFADPPNTVARGISADSWVNAEVQQDSDSAPAPPGTFTEVPQDVPAPQVAPSGGVVPKADVPTQSIKQLSAGWLPSILPSARLPYFRPLVRATPSIGFQDITKMRLQNISNSFGYPALLSKCSLTRAWTAITTSIGSWFSTQRAVAGPPQ